jgi:ABC-2 type transport system permease protein
MFLRICNLVAKEFSQFFRDRLMAIFILTLPVLQLILLAQATGSRISNICVAVLDLDRSEASRRLISALDNRQELEVCRHATTLEETHRLLDQGQVTLVVVIPAGFAADLASGSRMPHLQVVADAGNSVPARIALAAARTAVTGFTARWAEEAGISQALSSPVELRFAVRFNPTLNVRFFTVPAQVGFIVYQVTLAIASVGLARERELGTLEQLLVMPLSRVELVIGKAIPALVIGMLNFGLMLAVAVYYFGVPLRGSLGLLIGLTLLFVVAEIGYGILISALARTQQQAILFVFVLAMVDMTFSGYLVRVKNLPVTLQAIAQVVPFRHYLTIIRGVMLKGAGIDALWPHAVAMLAVGLLVAIVAGRSLGRSLE